MTLHLKEEGIQTAYKDPNICYIPKKKTHFKYEDGKKQMNRTINM